MFIAFVELASAPSLELEFISRWGTLRTQKKCWERQCHLIPPSAEGLLVRVNDICVVARILNLKVIVKPILVPF